MKKHMKRIGRCLLGVFVFATFSAHAQSKEIDRVRETVLKTHLNDEFYMQIRCFYDVRLSIDDYILLKENGIGIWRAEHRKEITDPPPWEWDRDTQRKIVTKVSYMEEDNIEAFLKAIDIDRLVQGLAIDSLSLPVPDDPENQVLGGWSRFAIMICSKGTFRQIEYPCNMTLLDKLISQHQVHTIVPWKSAYLDNLLARLTQALHMENDRIYRSSQPLAQ